MPYPWQNGSVKVTRFEVQRPTLPHAGRLNPILHLFVAAVLGVAGCGDTSSEQSCDCPDSDTTALTERVACVLEQVRTSLSDENIPPAGAFFDTLRNIAASMRQHGALSDSGDACVEVLTQQIYGAWGVTFDPDQDELLSLLPHTIVSRGKGSCLGVSLLFLMLAEHTGCPLYGVLLPGHFFVRFTDDDRRRNIEPNLKGYRHPDSYYRDRYGVNDSSWYDLRELKSGEVMAVVHYNLGNMYRMRGRLREAVACYRRCAAALDGYAEAWGNLAISYEQLDSTDSARSAFTAAMKRRPALVNLALNYGTFELRHKRFGDALVIFGQGLLHHPGSADLLFGKGLAYCGLGERDSAEKILTVLRRDNENSDRAGDLERALGKVWR